MSPDQHRASSVDNHLTRVVQAWHGLPLTLASLIMAAPLLVLLWALVWSALQTKTQALQQKEEGSITRNSQLSAQSLKTLFVSADQVLLELRGYWQNHPAEFEQVLQDRRNKLELGDVFDVTVIDARAHVVKSRTQQSAIHHTLYDSTLWSRHRDDPQDRLLMGPAFLDRITDLWLLPFTRPLLSSSGEFEGVITFLVPTDYFSRVLQHTTLRNDSVFSLIDLETGNLILRGIKVPGAPTTNSNSTSSTGFWSMLNAATPVSSSGVIVSQLPPPVSSLSDSALNAANALPVSGMGWSVSEIDPIERLYGWEKLERIPLLLSVGAPTSGFDKLLSTHQLRHAITGLAFSLLALALAAGFNLYDRSRRRNRQALRLLAAHQTDLIEDERRLLAREIHDDLGQRLTALRLDLAMAINAMRSTSSAGLLAQVEQLKGAIDDILRITRDLSKKVRPPSLDIGFLPAVEALCDEFNERLPATVRFVNHTHTGIVPSEACAIAAFRLLQESLNNAARHAHCRHIDISLDVVDGWLHLWVVDDGVGFDPQTKPRNRTYGLLGMHERVAALGGELRLKSQTGQGCKLLFLLHMSGTATEAGSP
jgi:signal transduction histidine kinase